MNTGTAYPGYAARLFRIAAAIAVVAAVATNAAAQDPSDGAWKGKIESAWTSDFAAGGQPLVVEGLVVAPTSPAGVIAIEAATGRTAWVSPVSFPAAPVIAGGHEGQVVVKTGESLFFLNARTGGETGRYSLPSGFSSTGGVVQSGAFIPVDAGGAERTKAYALDLATGKEIWRRDNLQYTHVRFWLGQVAFVGKGAVVVQEIQKDAFVFGMAIPAPVAAPAERLAGNILVAVVDNRGGEGDSGTGVAGVDLGSRKVAWERAFPTADDARPLDVTVAGGVAYVVSRTGLTALDAASGRDRGTFRANGLSRAPAVVGGVALLPIGTDLWGLNSETTNVLWKYPNAGFPPFAPLSAEPATWVSAGADKKYFALRLVK